MEIEIKIMLEKRHLKLIHDWLDNQHFLSKEQNWLGNDYYDTSTQFFATAQMGLRVRNKNSQYELTLKTKGEAINGLHIRPEYNLSLPSNYPDFKRLVAEHNLPILEAANIEKNLVQVFSTNFKRTQWLIAYQQSEIEIALDEGLIKNSQAEAEICEIELELKSGNQTDLLSFLTQLPLQDGMWLSNLSKAQRGYLLDEQKWQNYLEKFNQKLAKNNFTQALNQELVEIARLSEISQSHLALFNQWNKTCFTDYLSLKQYLISKDYLFLTLDQFAIS